MKRPAARHNTRVHKAMDRIRQDDIRVKKIKEDQQKMERLYKDAKRKLKLQYDAARKTLYEDKQRRDRQRFRRGMDSARSTRTYVSDRGNHSRPSDAQSVPSSAGLQP